MPSTKPAFLWLAFGCGSVPAQTLAPFIYHYRSEVLEEDVPFLLPPPPPPPPHSGVDLSTCASLLKCFAGWTLR